MAIVFTYTKSTNIAVVTGGTSGTPATFADFVTADRAGSVTLLVATAGLSPTLPLTYQITPVEKLALLISFVVASKTTQTDYIFITGTDAWDAAQTESIDVSAGNGTYVSTKRFRTITNIDCSDNAAGGGTVWADGTVAVTQPQWGVIWNKGNNQYQLDCKFNIGNGSTSTYFTESAKQVVFKTGIPTAGGQKILSVTANATLTFGVLVDETDKTTKDGCSISFLEASYWGTAIDRALGTCYLYGCLISSARVAGITLGLQYIDRMWNGIMDGVYAMSGYGNPMGINNVTVLSPLTVGCQIEGGVGTIQGIRVFTAGTYGLLMKTGGIQTYTDCEVYNAVTSSFAGQSITAEKYLIDAIMDAWTITWIGGAANTKSIWRQHTINIHVADKDGINLASVTVLCEEQDGTDAFSVDTDANGNIAEQTVRYMRYYYSGGALTTTYSPHKFTISKAGYQTLVLDAITADHPIVWHLELQQPGGGGAAYKNIGIGVN